MMSRLSEILGHNYEPLNRIELSKTALKNNFQYLRSLDHHLEISPVLKSNAYGHGLAMVAKELDHYRCPFFCVDSLYEAYELSKNKIKTPILIMGSIHPGSFQTKILPYSFAVSSKEQLIALNKYQPHAKIHLFVDTGMHREGVPIDRLSDLISFIKSKTGLTIEGLMSHLAMSEKPENTYTRKQIDTFKKALDIVDRNGIFPKWVHLANSSGLLNIRQDGDSMGNLVRPGLSLFGIDPSGKNKVLKPVLRLITHITLIKEIRKGDCVGYGFSFRAKKTMKIALLPLGYHDGVDLRLSNVGCVKIGEKYCPIIGKVSMNITVIDVSNIKRIGLGQEVIVYSNTRTDKNSIENTARLIKTIPYELLVHLNSSTRRVFV
ncbi:MAG: hypothetical protein ACD_61C00296G0005 [uncultured bacterium]|nr:MAG: hypothetical protein ACD_61C00296G0005 [uncultured bacterium]